MHPDIKRLNRALVVWLVITALLAITMGAGVVGAASGWTQTSQADFESGTLFQLDTSGSPGDVKLAASGTVSNYIYALQGNKQKDFWRYDVAANSWSPLADTPEKVKWGGALACDGGNYIYAFRGYNTADFWRYDISADSWSSLADALDNVKDGGSLTCHSNGYVYALRGNGTTDFWRYDISADSWSSLADAQDAVYAGGALTGDVGNYIYSFQCDDTEAFYHYDIIADSWTLLADTPWSVGNGAALAYDNSGYVYALRGMYRDDFWRYNVSAESWSLMTDAPLCVEWGGALAHDGDNYIYVLRGRYTNHFWRYNISADSWMWKASTPGGVAYGGALVMGGVPYYGSGTLTSSAYDTGLSADFDSVSWLVTLPAGTDVKFQIASNSDNSTWDFVGPDGNSGTYYTLSGSDIWTGHDSDRFIKYKAFFSTTNVNTTPVLHDITVNYGQMVVLPVVTTGNATLVEETTATVNGTINDDGGKVCQYRFEYGMVSGGPYPHNTGWTGDMISGQPFSADLTGLSEGTKCYFHAQAKNSAGTANGAEMSFLTKPEPPVDMTFIVTVVSDTQIDLTWTKGTGAYRTMIRRKTGDYPVDRNDGVLVYFDTGTGVSDTGLSPGMTYYYRVWSEVTGSQQWSDSYLDVSGTTSGEPSEPPVAVGGTVYQVNKAQVLAPWLSIFLLLAASSVVFYLKRKRTHFWR